MKVKNITLCKTKLKKKKNFFNKKKNFGIFN